MHTCSLATSGSSNLLCFIPSLPTPQCLLHPPTKMMQCSSPTTGATHHQAHHPRPQPSSIISSRRPSTAALQHLSLPLHLSPPSFDHLALQPPTPPPTN